MSQNKRPIHINPDITHTPNRPASVPTAALIGGAAVVVAGVTDRVALDVDVVLEDDCDGVDVDSVPVEVVPEPDA